MCIHFAFYASIHSIRNALNIVKDDLIVKVDELTGEIEILREELNTANQSRSKLRQRVTELEDEIKQNKSLAKAHGKYLQWQSRLLKPVAVFNLYRTLCSQFGSRR